MMSRNSSDGCRQSLLQQIKHPGLGRVQELFDLGPARLDGVEVGRIGRQIKQLCPGLLDPLPHAGEKKPLSLSSIDMNKTTENTKIATQKSVANPHQMKGVMSAVKAVIGEEPDTFADVDDHPGSLDLPTQKHKATKLLADFRRLPKGSAERFQAFRKLLKVLHDEYAE
jgi:hypothetical protein